MNDVVEMAKFFFLSLGYGTFLFAPVADSKMTGGGFQKLLSSVALVSLFFANVAHIVLTKNPVGIENIILYISMTAILFHHSLHSKHDEKTKVLWFLYALPSALGLISIYLFQKLNVVNFLFIGSASYYIGVVTYLMILGHWYLVTPKLSEKPLKIALIVMWIIILPKLIWSGVSTYQASEYLELGTRLGGGYSFNWIMMIMRWVWGYVVIISMSIFGWKLVAMRSTQSATGIFYSMTIFIFIGEMISGFLFFKYGLLI